MSRYCGRMVLRLPIISYANLHKKTDFTHRQIKIIKKETAEFRIFVI